MRALIVVSGFLLAQGAAFAADGYPIAGLTPSVRPAGAPVITEVKRTPEAEAAIFYGVTKPYPASILPQVSDQGNWFTPFNHPGMPGPYDIRGWHQAKKAKKS